MTTGCGCWCVFERERERERERKKEKERDDNWESCQDFVQVSRVVVPTAGAGQRTGPVAPAHHPSCSLRRAQSSRPTLRAPRAPQLRSLLPCARVHTPRARARTALLRSAAGARCAPAHHAAAWPACARVCAPRAPCAHREVHTVAEKGPAAAPACCDPRAAGLLTSACTCHLQAAAVWTTQNPVPKYVPGSG